uniref:Endonuclease/exonuclease/phosphatase domain-containing protein n=1 Tax=Nyssomyia neivai TaxID=330878 RepID=A0A1L8D886_9DIPT
MVDKLISSEEIELNTDLQAVAVQILYPLKLTICNIYIPPRDSLQISSLNSLIQQLPSPFILIGDFNGHNPLWDINCINSDRKEIRDLFLNYWQAEWNKSGEPLYEIKVPIDKWRMPSELSRRESVAITRLRIGRTRYTHGYRIQKNPSEDSKLCETCNNVENNVEHVLIHCIQFEKERKQCNLSNQLKIILSDNDRNMKKLLNFLYITKLIDYI